VGAKSVILKICGCSCTHTNEGPDPWPEVCNTVQVIWKSFVSHLQVTCKSFVSHLIHYDEFHQSLNFSLVINTITRVIPSKYDLHIWLANDFNYDLKIWLSSKWLAYSLLMTCKFCRKLCTRGHGFFKILFTIALLMHLEKSFWKFK